MYLHNHSVRASGHHLAKWPNSIPTFQGYAKENTEEERGEGVDNSLIHSDKINYDLMG